jgi:hypothetical protein
MVSIVLRFALKNLNRIHSFRCWHLGRNGLFRGSKKRNAAIELGENFSNCRSSGEERPLLQAEAGEQAPKPDLLFAGNFSLVRTIAENIEQICPSSRKEKRVRPESLPTKKGDRKVASYVGFLKISAEVASQPISGATI